MGNFLRVTGTGSTGVTWQPPAACFFLPAGGFPMEGLAPANSGWCCQGCWAWAKAFGCLHGVNATGSLRSWNACQHLVYRSFADNPRWGGSSVSSCVNHSLKAIACLREAFASSVFTKASQSLWVGEEHDSPGEELSNCVVHSARLRTITELPTPSNYVIQDTRGSYLPGAAYRSLCMAKSHKARALGREAMGNPGGHFGWEGRVVPPSSQCCEVGWGWVRGQLNLICVMGTAPERD